MGTLAKYLQDNFKWYRRKIGGTWINWYGFWEPIDKTGIATFKRNPYIDSDGNIKYLWNAEVSLPFDSIFTTDIKNKKHIFVAKPEYIEKHPTNFF